MNGGSKSVKVSRKKKSAKCRQDPPKKKRVANEESKRNLSAKIPPGQQFCGNASEM